MKKIVVLFILLFSFKAFAVDYKDAVRTSCEELQEKYDSISPFQRERIFKKIGWFHFLRYCPEYAGMPEYIHLRRSFNEYSWDDDYKKFFTLDIGKLVYEYFCLSRKEAFTDYEIDHLRTVEDLIGYTTVKFKQSIKSDLSYTERYTKKQEKAKKQIEDSGIF